MRKFILLSFLLFLLPKLAHGQATQIQSGPVNPTKCDPTKGQLFFNNSTSPGVFYYCTSLNTWSAVSTGGGGCTAAGVATGSVQYNNGNTCPVGSTAFLFVDPANGGPTAFVDSNQSAGNTPAFTAALTTSNNNDALDVLDFEPNGPALANLVGRVVSGNGQWEFNVFNALGGALTKVQFKPDGTWFLAGTTSGGSGFRVAAVAGSPNAMQLPLLTALAGQLEISDGGNPQQLTWASPGVKDGNGQAAVTSTPYVIACDSATTSVGILDRVTTIRFQSGASVITAPDHTVTGCGSNMAFSLIDDGAGTLTVNRGGSDTFTVINGSTNTDGATSFTLTSGQYATLNNGAGGIWEVRVVGIGSVASGTAAMGTSAIGSGACATVVTISATGVATTDTITASFNGDPTGVTGYGVSATGAVLTIYPYPTANNVNFKVCNSTASSITPSALTLNWKVVR